MSMRRSLLEVERASRRGRVTLVILHMPTTLSPLSQTLRRAVLLAALLALLLAGLGFLVYPGAQAAWQDCLPGLVAVAIVLAVYAV
jgi:hypothetical protein